MTDCLLLDVDGTLVDTNYLHTAAWYRAFLRYELVVPAWRIHRAIGMGGDRLVPFLVGDRVEEDLGEEIRAAWAEEYQPLLEFVHPLPGARRLLAEAAGQGIVTVLASSGPADHVEHYIDLLDAWDVVPAWTTSDDVSDTKPEPDLLRVALAKVEVDRAVTVGDSVWDCDAAQRLGVPAIGVLSGGVSRAELLEHDASLVYDGVEELRADLKELPFTQIRP
jgi:HAD superfamily hydrolase (TIGR01549 family)